MLLRIIRYLMSFFPESFVTRIRLIRKLIKKKYYTISQKLFPTYVTSEDLISAFRSLGIKAGDNVFMHSAMSKFGVIKGGAITVINALKDVVGQDGLIAMPAYPYIGSFKKYIESSDIFDARNDKSAMGVITEAFRKWDGTERSVHPTHSVCANGKGAKEFVEKHENCPTPFAEGSPFEKAVRGNFTLLLFGVDFGPVSIYHVLEDMLGDKFPYKVYEDKIYKFHCVDMQGNHITVKTPKHNSELSKFRIDSNPAVQDRIFRLFKKDSLTSEVKVGKGRIFAIKLEDLINSLAKYAEMGITIYGIK